jgi:hypothetical protein
MAMSGTVILRKYSRKSMCLKYGRIATTWSVERNAVINGHTDGQLRRSWSNSSSFKMRVGDDVT